ncbi:two-component sensor histidine kinase [Acidisarcina polymorpha]|uniref:histidine kinase n=1 Tax=Acidisarcina polymorpha TaxID=2211140 RepID=A0A2Z5G2G2_9BACT|nr:two-component sensor histidine kinase [Acidisarcina polymorpha]
MLYKEGEQVRGLSGLLRGEIRGFKKEDDGSRGLLLHFTAGESFGEVPLLTGRPATVTFSEVVLDTTLIRVDEEGFWRLMATCPVVRQAVVANMERRLQDYQAFALHREKLMSLGTLAAGLMHELNNPGTAARRAAAQLRENLVQLQQISLRFCESPLQGEQIDCMKSLQKRALTCEKQKAMSSLDQSDAEECLAEWLDAAGVQNSWKMAPTLTSVGITDRDLDCTQHAFRGADLSDALNWLASLVSSMQLVVAIEESITRVSELVTAVKKYSYNENTTQVHVIDVHDGLQSTITILAHKLRPKDLKVDKKFAANLPEIESRGAGLTQVWTNLIDNAVDASPDRGTIYVRTWAEDGFVCVGIADEGSGIPEEFQKHIFDPFFTTKPVGVGTGLGLDIARRIVVSSFGGEIGFNTTPGKTEFVVRIPTGKSTS